MVDRTAKLEAALRVNAALRVQAERLIAAYVAPESDRGSIINELISLFDGAKPSDLLQKRWARLLTASTTIRRQRWRSAWPRPERQRRDHPRCEERKPERRMSRCGTKCGTKP
jgi:hypothetical protein